MIQNPWRHETLLTLVIRSCFASTVIVLAASAASEGMSQSTISSPGGFVQAASYSSTCGCGMDPGSDLAVHLGTAQDYHELAFAGPGFSQASAAYSGGMISNDAHGTAGLGVFRPFAENSAPPPEFFPLAAANGGWKESFTINNAGLTGQIGYMVFRIRARGMLRATDFTGAARLTVAAYKNQVLLVANPYFSNQPGSWGVAGYGPGWLDEATVDSVVTMGAPITFGETFTLGVYGLAVAGMRSSGGAPGISTSRCDFSVEGVTWNGIADILDAAGQPVLGSTIVSGSGIDWSGPYAGASSVGSFDERTNMSLHMTSATPSAGAVGFSLFLPHAAAARVGVYDILGRRTRLLADRWLPEGSNQLEWDGTGDEGAAAGTGVYFLRAEWEGQVAARRVVHVR